MAIRKLTELDLKDKTVILRAALDAPVVNGSVTDEYRIDKTLPTLTHLIKNNCKIIIISKRGRPDGSRDAEFSMKPVVETLSAKLNHNIKLIDNFRMFESKQEIMNAAPGTTFMLENIRFSPDEESKDDSTRKAFAAELAEMAQYYVNDAFADYRPHASTYDLPMLYDNNHKAIGIQFEREMRAIDDMMNKPARPFVAVIGGAKLSTKIDILHVLGAKADKILIGGAMAYTFLKAQGISVGNSMVEEDKLELAKEILEKYKDKIMLPIDHIAAESFNEHASSFPISGNKIQNGMWGVDIGPDTIEAYTKEILQAKTILWNGPMGVFEWLNFANGTRQLGIRIADQEAYTLVGGGDTVSAITMFELEYGIDHISTGGGATLEYIATNTLPTIPALQ